MFVFLILAIVILLLLNVLLTAAVLVRVAGRPEGLPKSGVVQENGIQTVIDCTGAPHSSGREARDIENLMDEGFENIMRFQVGGKTGFEQE